MTKGKAIEILRECVTSGRAITNGCHINDTEYEVLKIAIKALEQSTNDCKIFGTKQNCFGGATEYECNHCDYKQTTEQQPIEDYVSRQAVNEYLEKLLDGRFDDFMSAAIIGIKDNINAMPPVTPTHGICKDCSHYDPLTCNSGTCLNPNMQWSNEVSATHYCADFEKRGNSDGSN